MQSNDGAIIPSFLQLGSQAAFSNYANEQSFGHVKLRTGYTIQKNIPKSPEQGEGVTYDVLLPIEEQGAVTNIVVRNCRVMAPLGGVGDYANIQFRTPASYGGRLDKQALEQASKVLVLFLNGRTVEPIIIGALQHPLGEADLVNQLVYSLNGVTLIVDNEGQLRVQYGGKTKADGTPVATDKPESASGSYVLFDLDGNITLSTGGGNPQQVRLGADGTLSLNGTESVAATTKKATIQASESTTIDTPKLTIGSGGQSMMRGSAYRQAESQMLQTLKAAIESASAQLTAQGAILNALSTALGLGPTGGAPITVAGSALAGAAVAIADFEAKAATYLNDSKQLD